MFFKNLKSSQKPTPTEENHSELEAGRTLTINNPHLLKAAIGRETLVACGAPRGMTSLISFTLFELGYFIGSELQEHNFEDQEFSKAIPPKSRFKGKLISRPAFRNLVKQRNAEHERWGFKLPGAANYLPELNTTLRNPVFVLCIRNPLAIMRSIARRNSAYAGGTPGYYRNGLGWLDAMGFLMSTDSIPSLMIDMDEVRRSPATFLTEFTSALRLGEVPDGLLERISRQGYKASKAQPNVTFVGPRNKRG